MRPGTTVFDWIQIITGVAVLAGIVLVILELQQSHTLSRAESTVQTYSDFMGNQQSVLSENFSQTYAKACTNPLDLTDAELREMRAYADMQLITITRMRRLQEIAAYDYDWRVSATGSINRWIATPVGIAQFHELKDRLHPELVQIVESRIDESPDYQCKEEVEGIRSILKGMVD